MSIALKRIETPVVSVSELRKNFTEVVKKSAEAAGAIYIFNNNQPAAVMIDPEIYAQFTKEFDELKKYREEQIRQEEAEILKLASDSDPGLRSYEAIRSFSDDLWEEAVGE